MILPDTDAIDRRHKVRIYDIGIASSRVTCTLDPAGTVSGGLKGMNMTVQAPGLAYGVVKVNASTTTVRVVNAVYVKVPV
jgi:hypothetical protein